MSSIFGGGKSASAPKPQPLPQAPTASGAGEKANANLKKRKAASEEGGRSIYSSPMGASGEAQVLRKTLLGQ